MSNRNISNIWPAEHKVVKQIHDIRVSVLKNAHGPASLRFSKHTIMIVESAVSISCGPCDNSLVSADYPRHAIIFAPKHADALSVPKDQFDVTVVEIPDHWFDQALRRIGSELSIDELDRFDTKDDHKLLYSSLLLKNLAVGRQLPDVPQLSILLIVAMAERVLLHHVQAEEFSKIFICTGSFSAARMKLVSNYIDEHITGPIRLADMAGFTGLSPFHFSRVFRNASGATPMRYVLERRVSLAKSLLEDRTLSLVAIALNCGFSSQSHFTTAFRQVTGVTPARYRAGH